MIWKRKIVFKIFFMATIAGKTLTSVFGQEELPEKPLILQVSIDSVTGLTEIAWSPVNEPDILGYKIYTLDISTFPVTGYLLDSVGKETFQYSYYSNNKEPENYTIVAVDSTAESLLGGDYHSPVFLEIDYDSCINTIKLAWTPYVGWNNNLNGYRIYYKTTASSSGQGGPAVQTDFHLLEQLDAKELIFNHTGIAENEHYEYVIEAYDNSGKTSTSNRSKYYTFMPLPPLFLHLDYVSVVDEQHAQISFSTELSGAINDFQLLRSNAESSSYSPLTTFIDITEPTIIYEDNFATLGQTFFYKVQAMNSCFAPVMESNTGNNILARGHVDNQQAILNWNSYKDFVNGVAGYNIYRKNVAGEFDSIGQVDFLANSFAEDFSNSGYQDLDGRVIYLVEAIENTWQESNASRSRSNEIAVNTRTDMFIPNAFTPNDDNLNDEFLPIMDFIPESYRMLILDRTGKILFTSTDPFIGWDGTLSGSEKAREGTYVYHIEYISFDGFRKVQTGNLILLYP